MIFLIHFLETYKYKILTFCYLNNYCTSNQMNLGFPNTLCMVMMPNTSGFILHPVGNALL